MRRMLLAVAVMAVASAAQAALWCKSGLGETLVWKIGDQRPANAANFGGTEPVVCMVNGQIYRDLAAGALGVRDFPIQGAIPSPQVAQAIGSGAIYRGNQARWLIDNLPSSYGAYATWSYFESIQP